MNEKEVVLKWLKENKKWNMKYIDVGYDVFVNRGNRINYRSGSTFYNGSLWKSSWNVYIMTEEEEKELNTLLNNI